MIHLSRSLLSCSLVLSLAAAPAFARDVTKVPPSGITIHLFGPESVSSQIMSNLPGSGGSSGSGSKASGGAAATGGTGAATPADESGSSSPTWHDVMHQMFVVGDPQQEGAAALSKGKTGGN